MINIKQQKFSTEQIKRNDMIEIAYFNRDAHFSDYLFQHEKSSIRYSEFVYLFKPFNFYA